MLIYTNLIFGILVCVDYHLSFLEERQIGYKWHSWFWLFPSFSLSPFIGDSALVDWLKLVRSWKSSNWDHQNCKERKKEKERKKQLKKKSFLGHFFSPWSLRIEPGNSYNPTPKPIPFELGLRGMDLSFSFVIAELMEFKEKKKRRVPVRIFGRFYQVG